MTKDKFNEYLDNEYGYFEVCGMDFPASEVLKVLNPSAYRQEYKEWFNELKKENCRFINETDGGITK